MTENLIKCNKGWEKLYEPIIKMIFEHDDKQEKESDKIGIHRIEPFDGALNIILENYQNSNKELEFEIEKACRESLRTCEICGSKDSVGTTMNFEYVTCCRSCWMKNILSKNSESIWKDSKTGKTYHKKI